MQQQQQYSNYPYWQQPVYPQPHPHPPSQPVYPQPLPPHSNGGYTPFPNHYVPLGPPPSVFDPAAYQPHEPVTPHKKHRRSKTVGAPSTPAPPLKPALKKTNTLTAFPTTEHQQSRSRTNSVSRQDNTLVRIRTQSNGRLNVAGAGKVIADTELNCAHHMFLSFHGYNEIWLENVSTPALKEIQERVWTLWPDGATSEVVNYTTVVKFFNDPWDMSSMNANIAYHIIVELFSLCASRGYSYQTSYNLTSIPRLIFQPTSSDDLSKFFLGYLSNGGRKFTLVKAPDPINVGLNPRLRDMLPANVTLDLGASGDLKTVELKQSGWLGSSKKALSPKFFFMLILRIISEFGFYLNASLPLYRRGPMGIRLRREILVFKGVPPI